MLWPDLAAYGDIKLKVSSRGSEPAAMFVMDGGDTIAQALRHSGFRRMKSGLWMRTFRPSDCADILSWLAFDLPLAVIRETDPAEILTGYRAPVAPPAAADVAIVETLVEETTTIAAGPEVGIAGAVTDMERAHHDHAEGMFASGVEDTIVDPAGGEEIAPPAENGRHERPAPLAEALAALADLAAWIGRRGASIREEDSVAGPGEGNSGVLAPSGGVLATEAYGADEILELDLSWIVSASAFDARMLTGLARLEERNYLVAKLACRNDALAASRQVGMIARGAPGGPDVRILAVVRGADGSGFGRSSDFLLIGDPGDGVGPLLAPEIAVDTAAA